MGLETGTYVDDLVITNPPGGDDKRQGDDHIRLIKSVLRNTIQRGSKALYLPGVSSKTTDYTILSSDENLTFVCDTTSAALTLTLPVLTSAQYGWTINVVKTNSGTNPIYLMPSSGTINGYAKVRRSIENSITKVEWVGSWIASRPNGGAPVGSVIEYYGSTLPNGHLWANGAAFTAANYVELNATLGVALVPDKRGRVGIGRDDMGGSAAGNITLAVAGFDGTVLSASGGAQSITLTTAQLASHSHGFGTLVATADTSHTHSVGTLSTGVEVYQGGANSHQHFAPALSPSSQAFLTGGSTNALTGVGYSGISASLTQDANTPHSHTISGNTGVPTSHSTSMSGSTATEGSATPHRNIPPAIICNSIVVAE